MGYCFRISKKVLTFLSNADINENIFMLQEIKNLHEEHDLKMTNKILETIGCGNTTAQNKRLLKDC